MSIFTLKHADKFGYFGTFDEAHKVGKEYLGAEIKEVKCEGYQSEKLYTMGGIFFTDVKSASLYTRRWDVGMINKIFEGMQNSKVYGLAYMFYIASIWGVDDIDRAFDVVKKRGDLYQIKKGVFNVPTKIIHLPDEITENYRLVYEMAIIHSKLYNSIECTDDEDNSNT
uniref:Uncharacterized protein n=1 Tax=Pithovirus LCPAC403 TaxID=2506596 RepID=A0A481ZD75_9VIRU|nr:MAG: hypothetical protein LCPAC403_01330 [Pithovirus LCPAC403]